MTTRYGFAALVAIALGTSALAQDAQPAPAPSAAAPAAADTKPAEPAAEAPQKTRLQRAAEQLIVDDELSVPSGGIQTRPFDAPKGGTLALEVRGLKNTDKGFDVMVMTLKQLEDYRSKRPLSDAPPFQGAKVTGSRTAKELVPGSYVIVVANKYNLMKAMVVRVRAALTP